MYRYVFKRIFKDTVDFGVNVRKSFACHQSINNQNQNDTTTQQQQQQQKSIAKYQEVNFLPSTDKSTRKSHEDFKRRYNCNHPHKCNPFIHAITWSTALIAGFYASQLLCLYRRSKHFDTQKCFYSRYLHQKSKQLHRRVLCAKEFSTKQALESPAFKFSCPLKKKFSEHSTLKEEHDSVQTKKAIDEFKELQQNYLNLRFFDKRYEKFYDTNEDLKTFKRKVYNLSNTDDSSINIVKSKNDDKTVKNLKDKDDSKSKTDNESIDTVMTTLTEMIGELEFQMGVDCILHGHYKDAVEHFRMSTNSNHAGACFNLALLYEKGLGVKKDMQVALRLYQMASDAGHDKALYNLGVFFSKGMGGVKKSFKTAKKYFTKSAELGNAQAQEALSLMLPDSKYYNSLQVPNDFMNMNKNISLTEVSNYHKNFRSIAVT